MKQLQSFPRVVMFPVSYSYFSPMCPLCAHTQHHTEKPKQRPKKKFFPHISCGWRSLTSSWSLKGTTAATEFSGLLHSLAHLANYFLSTMRGQGLCWAAWPRVPEWTTTQHTLKESPLRGSVDHSCHKYLLSIYYPPGTRETWEHEWERQSPWPHGACCVERETNNERANTWTKTTIFDQGSEENKTRW